MRTRLLMWSTIADEIGSGAHPRVNGLRPG